MWPFCHARRRLIHRLHTIDAARGLFYNAVENNFQLHWFMSMMDRDRRKLHLSGYKATPQRGAVLSFISEREGHFTPQQLYHGLREKYPAIGQVTVYRSLKALAEAGLVCEVSSAHNARCYTRCSAEHHHHLICRGCDRVVDFNHCELSKLEKGLSEKTGFAIHEHRLEFYGLCRRCQKIDIGEEGK